MGYMEVYKSWCDNMYFDEATRDELKSIANDEKEIEDRFYKDLEFGTGGLRGVIAGTVRLPVFSPPVGCPDFGRCCRRGVQGRRYTSFHIRPSGVEGYHYRERGVGLPCFGGERGPSNDAESLGYRVARPGSRGNPVSGPSECSLRGENGLANRTTCCLSVPRKIPRDERQASQSADRPIRSFRTSGRNAFRSDSISGIRLSRRRTARSRT